MFRVVVLLSGRGSNFEAIIRAVESGELQVEIAGVLSDKKDAYGLEIARKHGLKTVVVERRKEEQSLSEFYGAVQAAVAGLAPDLVVLAGFMRVIPEELIRSVQGRIINIHPGLLPAFKGLGAQKQALEAGVKFSGCTVHYVTSEVDAGMLIAQAVVPVYGDDTEETLSARILVEEHKLLPAAIGAIAEGRLEQREGRVFIRNEKKRNFAFSSLEVKP